MLSGQVVFVKTGALPSWHIHSKQLTFPHTCPLVCIWKTSCTCSENFSCLWSFANLFWFTVLFQFAKSLLSETFLDAWVLPKMSIHLLWNFDNQLKSHTKFMLLFCIRWKWMGTAALKRTKQQHKVSCPYDWSHTKYLYVLFHCSQT